MDPFAQSAVQNLLSRCHPSLAAYAPAPTSNVGVVFKEDWAAAEGRFDSHRLLVSPQLATLYRIPVFI